MPSRLSIAWPKWRNNTLPHIGNDIVDLTNIAARDKSKDTLFLKRVFLPTEESLIVGNVKPDTVLWTLWSAKEAAYKAVMKANMKVSSSPRRYRVILPDMYEIQLKKSTSFKGWVETPEGTVFLTTMVTSQFVHSLCIYPIGPIPKDLIWQIKPCPPEQDASLYIRHLAGKKLAFHYHLPASFWKITERKEGFPPLVYFREKLTPIEISLSHDGRFVAFSLLLSKSFTF